MVHIIDHLSEVGEAYYDADLLIYPSEYEIFGLVPFEALLYGTPVIVTDDCGCGEFVRKGKCGYTVRFGDIEGLSDMIGYALSHPDENWRMVHNGQRYIKETLSWEYVVRLFEEVYRDVSIGQS